MLLHSDVMSFFIFLWCITIFQCTLFIHFIQSSKIYEKLKFAFKCVFKRVSVVIYIHTSEVFACHYVNTYNICVHT